MSVEARSDAADWRTRRPGAQRARADRAGDGREQRILGLDRKTIAPALLVLALALLMSVVLPSIDARTAYHDAVRRGDVAELAAGITLVPTPGWDLADGALVGHARSPVGDTAQTELIDGAVDFFVQAAPFAGTAPELLTRVDRINSDLSHARGTAAATTRRYAVTTREGAVGVAEDFASATRQGSVIAFVFRPRAASGAAAGQPTREGVEIVVSGPTGSIARRRDAIVAMIRSIRAAS
jgi:hypothetical protein